MQIRHILSGGASDGNEMTIGDYMAGKLNEPGAWDKANAYFNTLPQTGTGFWLGSMLLRFCTALLACGWFLARRQRTAG